MAVRVLIFQHTDECPPGLLSTFLADDGADAAVAKPYRDDPIPDLGRFDVLMAMGGEMNVWEERKHPWMIAEKAAIRRWVAEMRKPFLGVCLGHQLLADALGGTVGPAAAPEAGLLDVSLTPVGRTHPLLAGCAPTFRVVQWHGAEITALPAGAKVLAASPKCAVQAFEAAPCAFGVQYHIEATAEQAEDWWACEEDAPWLEKQNEAGARERFLSDTKRAKAELEATARRVYDNFMRHARDRRGAFEPAKASTVSANP